MTLTGQASARSTPGSGCSSRTARAAACRCASRTPMRRRGAWSSSSRRPERACRGWLRWQRRRRRRPGGSRRERAGQRDGRGEQERGDRHVRQHRPPRQLVAPLQLADRDLQGAVSTSSQDSRATRRGVLEPREAVEEEREEGDVRDRDAHVPVGDVEQRTGAARRRRRGACRNGDDRARDDQRGRRRTPGRRPRRAQPGALCRWSGASACRSAARSPG